MSRFLEIMNKFEKLTFLLSTQLFSRKIDLNLTAVTVAVAFERCGSTKILRLKLAALEPQIKFSNITVK